jgi:serine/threonine protein kinase
VVARWRQEPLNIPSLRTRCPELPPSLSELVDRCLHVDPADRPTAEQIMKILNALSS